MSNHPQIALYTTIIIAIALLISTGILAIERPKLKSQLAGAEEALENLKESSLTKEEELNTTIINLETDVESLQERLREEKERNDDFYDQISEISGTVQVLDKLAKTDEELLQKYSKVYFLNEHFVPQKLVNIDTEFLVSENKPLQFHGDAYYFLKKLLEEAKEDDLNLKVTSAFRSFGTQSSLKNQYEVTYGAGTANQFSADQGYSEHQLGTALDFTTPELNGAFDPFADTEEYEWLLENAHKYGFTLSYPEGNSYYQFEPWHWRFVGVDLATYLHEENLNFYDVDQRKINEYLVSIFDKN